MIVGYEKIFVCRPADIRFVRAAHSEMSDRATTSYIKSFRVKFNFLQESVRPTFVPHSRNVRVSAVGYFRGPLSIWNHEMHLFPVVRLDKTQSREFRDDGNGYRLYSGFVASVHTYRVDNYSLHVPFCNSKSEYLVTRVRFLLIFPSRLHYEFKELKRSRLYLICITNTSL